MRRFLFNNGIALLFISLFLLATVGELIAGWQQFNDEQDAHREPTISLLRYAYSSDFAVAMAENWQSEFLQFTTFFLASIWLFQRGSAESEAEENLGLGTEEEERLGRHATAESPVLARVGGAATALYSHSLALAMTAFFLGSWLAQSFAGWAVYNAEQQEHDEATVSWTGYLGSPDFWERSFQNWQSEFMAVATIALLSIYLRQRGSHDSKHVGEPHAKTGTD